MKNNNVKNKKLSDKVKEICSITVKNEGRALNIVFILCLICIIALSIYIYRSSTNFYQRLDEAMHDNVNLNVEALRNEHIDYVEDLLNNKLNESIEDNDNLNVEILKNDHVNNAEILENEHVNNAERLENEHVNNVENSLDNTFDT